MTTRQRVDVTDLSSWFTTRRRGEEAYSALLPTLQCGEVVLDLNAADSVSASFLDGLLLRLASGGHLESVLFGAVNPRTLSVLGRLSSIRGIDILLLNGDGAVERVEPYPVPAIQPTLTHGKSGLEPSILAPDH